MIINVKSRMRGFLRRVLRIPLNRVLKLYLHDFLVSQHTVCGDKSRVEIAPTASVANTLFNVSSGRIIIEDYVFCGHNVSIITGTHDYRKTGFKRHKAVPREGRDVIIKKGAWIASNAIILGPCVIGENSVISAGCVVSNNVPPNTICFSDNPLTMKKISKVAADRSARFTT